MSDDTGIIVDEPSEQQPNVKGDRSLWTRRPSIKGFLVLVAAVAFYVLSPFVFPARPRPLRRPLQFYGVDNVTGFGSYVVPNIIHYVRFGQPNVSFIEAMSIRSAFINHGPDEIIIHCDVCQLDGPYGHLVREIPVLKLNKRMRPLSVFGLEVGGVEHASDIARLQTLLRYGGMYLDNDCMVIQPVHRYRHFEATIGWVYGAYMGNMIMLAAPGARFFRLYQQLYKEYNRSSWYYNAGDLPTMRLLWHHPHLIHRVPVLIGVGYSMLYKLYNPGFHPDWRDYHVVHTFLRHRSAKEDPLCAIPYDLKNVRTYNTSLGEMMREVLFGTSEYVNDTAEVKTAVELYVAKRRMSTPSLTVQNTTDRGTSRR
ncbi:uncharacterized protein LOC135366005 isoform X1 [Ornithodoros turicata]|uniref:uncharacterized protein LOC135366005 isoform X1 n=1 Tax=Ornithodoros turicata TaxID=34597 RepID=UPI003139A0D3